MKYEHQPDCCGWEDCYCFHTAVRNNQLVAMDRAVKMLLRLRYESENLALHDLDDSDLNEINSILREFQ